MVKNKFWGFYSHTRKDWRGQSLMKKSIILRNRLNIAEFGPLIVFGDINVKNISSMRAHRKRINVQQDGVLRVLEVHIPNPDKPVP